MEKCKSCCFTGHRGLSFAEEKAIREKISMTVKKLISIGVTTFYVGGALGFDMLAEEAVLEEKKLNGEIKLILAIPYPSYDESFSLKEKERYKKIVEGADDVITVSENYYKGCMHKRNRYMVDRALYLVSFCKKISGGSYYTKKYALESGLKILELS